MASVQLRPDDYGICKMTPKPNSSITLKRPVPEGQWTAPENPPKPFEGTPTAGANDISLDQPWAEFKMDVRLNLLDAIVTALQGLFASFTTLIAGEINKAVSDAAEKIRDLISDKFRELQITWQCRFDIDANATILVLHRHDYNVQITKTNNTAKDRMKWLVDTRLSIEGQMLDGARITVADNKTKVDTATKNDLFTVAPGEHVVESISRIRLDCEGFLPDIEDLFKKLVDAIKEGLDLELTIATYIAQWIRDHTTTGFWGGAPASSDVDAERKRKKDELAARIKADIKSFAETIYQKLLELLQEYKGQVAIDKSLVKLTCLSEAGAKRIREELHNTAKKEIDGHSDNREKTRDQLLKSEQHGMLIPGRRLIAEGEWAAMGLDDAAYYFVVVPADEVERPILPVGFTNQASGAEAGRRLLAPQSIDPRQIAEMLFWEADPDSLRSLRRGEAIQPTTGITPRRG